jgi:DNA polymerase elongation subunit (family B)
MEIISIELLNPEFTVYDLETEAGTFLAGSLNFGIMVKNTDSCYVKFPINREDFKSDESFMKEQFETAEKCAKYCTEQFKPPIELEFEKYMYPLALFAKKRYAYKEWTNYKTPDEEINYKGIQVVRRDTCKYVKEEMSKIFEIIMNSKTSKDACILSLEHIKSTVRNLLDGNVDISKLVLSKQLKSRYKVRKNNETNEYSWKDKRIQQPHVRLAQEIMKTDSVNHPKPPDRVPYLFEEKKNAILQCDKVIHPDNFNTGVNKIDSLYYFDHQLQKPIDMIFSLMMEDTATIYKDMIREKKNNVNGQFEITSFFKKDEDSLSKTDKKPEKMTDKKTVNKTDKKTEKKTEKTRDIRDMFKKNEIVLDTE